MKNIIQRGVCLLLLLAVTAALTACGQSGAKNTIYAVEAGSAGEEVAKEKGWTVNSVQDQAAALMEVAAGTSDAAVIDLLMAGAMIGPDTSYPNLTYTDSLTEEEYGIGCRQGSDLADFITEVLEDAYRDGTTQKLARQFGVREDLLVELPQTSYTQDAAGDAAYIQNKGTLVVGITYFAPMDYKEEGSDEWIGFDADLAKLFAESLGVSVEFQEITWDYKVEELDSRAIDCVWNGMTLTDDVLAAMGTSNPYCTNYQTLVYPADRAAEFEGLTSLEGLNIAVESGSAGEDAAVALGATTVPVQAQSNALMEVAAGTSDAAVIDVLMAAEMTGEGTSYADLIYSLNLNEAQDLPSEEYGVGFRQGSDLVDAFNTFLAEKTADGTVLEVATTYGLQDAVILE